MYTHSFIPHIFIEHLLNVKHIYVSVLMDLSLDMLILRFLFSLVSFQFLTLLNSPFLLQLSSKVLRESKPLKYSSILSSSCFSQYPSAPFFCSSPNVGFSPKSVHLRQFTWLLLPPTSCRCHADISNLDCLGSRCIFSTVQSIVPLGQRRYLRLEVFFFLSPKHKQRKKRSFPVFPSPVKCNTH